MKNKILVILGPTATGKTDLALSLAKKFDGELIACDSRQVYLGLDIGTGKMPGKWTIDNGELKIEKANKYWKVDGINIWMYDVAHPTKQYNVAQYVEDATHVVEDIIRRKKLPIIVGGTGLYLKALIYGLSNLKIPANIKLRVRLEQESLEKLQEQLKSLSPTTWDNLNQSDRQNKRRLIRKIELISMNPYMGMNDQHLGLSGRFQILKIGLTAPRSALNERIDTRVLSRFDQGMIKEAERLHKKGLSFKRMKRLGLEYGVLADYLSRKIKDLEQLKKIMQTKIHQYAKRQITWFKKEPKVFWFDITDRNWLQRVEKLASDWYNKDLYLYE